MYARCRVLRAGSGRKAKVRVYVKNKKRERNCVTMALWRFYGKNISVWV